MISSSGGNISTIMYDWNVYKDISFVGKKLSKTEEKTIIDELGPLANKLVQEKSGAKKPSFAFMALTTDYKNTLVDNYVTDALTEAMFNTGKIKIIERANLEAILSEQKFQSSGLVNEETVKSIGMIAGVDFVCYGNLKDLGDSLTVNARVVDVETGELCAISRATITKDDYLLNQSKAAVGVTNSITKNSSSTKTTSAPEVKKTTTPTQNNAWKVVQYRDDIEGYTQYIFRVFTTDERFVFVSYKKCDVAANSRVIAGIHWGECYDYQNSSYVTGTYDIKSDEGTISINYRDAWMHNLDTAGKEKFKFVWNQKDGSRLLTERFIKNETVSFRRDNLVRKFQTAGLLDKMAEYGVTWEEIDAAIASEEF
jgi:curli biogenesis system outer membrane secretion channel CsgG